MKLPLLLLFFSCAVFAEDDMWGDDDWADEEEQSSWSGFLEASFGTRLESDPLINNRHTLEEIRGRIESKWQPGRFTIGLKADVGYDDIENDGILDVRDLTVAFAAGKSLDVKVGRQVQTWGTGDLVFLNDFFPKDFVSFFSGRDDEYLKAPGDAIRLSHYAPLVNVDFSWTPVFEPDNYLNGKRFSYFSPLAGSNVAPDPPMSAIKPGKTFSNGEFNLRLFRTVNSREFAIYFYRGFFKRPNALTTDLEPTFAPLSSIGASLRQPAGPGIFNLEMSYYDSRDDRSGSDPLTPNDQFRFLAGYEWEARPRLTVGLQYYLERTLDYSSLLQNSPTPQYAPDEYRHLLTNRLTFRSALDKYTLSLFTYYSPSDRDAYARPVFNYRHSDRWSLTTGANLFGGDDKYTFFGQLEDASNIYLRVRYGY